MMHYNDTDFIRQTLEARLEDLVAYLYPAAVTVKGIAYPSHKNNKELGSFQINLTGDKRGLWYRHSQRVGGGILALIAYALYGHTNVNRDVFDEARRFLGIGKEVSPEEQQRRDDIAARRAKETEQKRKEQEAKAEREALAKQENAQALWDEGKPIAGTPAELYLLNRSKYLASIPSWSEELRFLERCWHAEAREWSPCLIARVTGVDGAFLGIWRIYITQYGQKAFGGQFEIKLGLGSPRGGAVRLGGMASKIGAAEGIETALAAYVLNGCKYPVWAMLSTSGLMNFEAPFEVEHVVSWEDPDLPRFAQDGRYMPSAGGSAAARLRDNMIEAGLKATRQLPPATGDFLDLLNETGEYL